MTYTELENAARAQGFSHMAPLNVNSIELREEVRNMCSRGCHRYGSCWSCPPGCGTLEACREEVHRYTRGILVQTVARLEDEFDGQSMMDAQNLHCAQFAALAEALRSRISPLLPLGAGCCSICKHCTYPNAPCRFPEKKISSMEAYGILVQDVCKQNGLTYYYGPCTIAYTSCILIP